jgi:hypothetical protein
MIEILSPTSGINFERIILNNILYEDDNNYISRKLLVSLYRTFALLVHWMPVLRNLSNYHTLIRFSFIFSEGPDMTSCVSQDVTSDCLPFHQQTSKCLYECCDVVNLCSWQSHFWVRLVVISCQLSFPILGISSAYFHWNLLKDFCVWGLGIDRLYAPVSHRNHHTYPCCGMNIHNSELFVLYTTYCH